jgi:histidinol dehydrogenase
MDDLIRIVPSADTAAVDALVTQQPADLSSVEKRVRRVIADVREDGDRALRAWASRLDGLTGHVEVTRPEMERLAAEAPRDVRAAIRAAARHIRTVARAQVPRGQRTTVAPGVTVEQRVTPLARVGCYVPGGRYPLPSSLLMTAVPARAAGVPEVIACCPTPAPAVMAAAIEAGVDRFFQVGGAQAVAAMAYGTATVPRVDKIVGPGSAYVAVAKAQVARDCAIDFFAGPSEIVIVAVEGAPDWIAADLIAQAEHDTDARALLLTPRARLARAVAKAVTRQMPADGPAAEALRRNGGIILTRTLAEAAALANRIAPEHLVVDSEATARLITVAGAVFIGPFTAQAAGDYAIGSNHVLPTSGAARFRGGLHASDFVRITSVQRLTAQGLARVGPTAVTLAHAEGLTAHAASVQMRLDALGVPGRRAAAAAAAATRRRGRT